MQSTSWKDIVELVGIVAIVGSLIFVGLQMRQAQEIAIADGYSALQSHAYARSELISANADLVAKANRGEELSEAEVFALDGFVTAIWHAEFFATARWEYLGRQTRGSEELLAIFLCENPGLIQSWRDGSEWQRNITTPSNILSEFVARMDERLDSECGE